MDLEHLQTDFDIVVAGGGITGAGVFSEAVRMGFSVLLVEKNDFAWGTSSRSSKLVHGGLRYLQQGRLHLTYESVCHRQRLMAEAPGLVEPLGFLMPIYKDSGPGRWPVKAGLTIYDAMAGARYHRYLDRKRFTEMAPGIKDKGLKGGFTFMDAQVDDARLVLRLIFDAVEKGGCALNYTRVDSLKQNNDGVLKTAVLKDTETGLEKEVSCKAVINATGCWAEGLHPSPDSSLHLRPLRGSHLMLAAWRLPVHQAITLVHPKDGRPLYIIPWEGALLLGTTDVDHGRDVSGEITMDPSEAAYMMECLQHYFPNAGLSMDDCISCWAGIRPVLSRGQAAPSRESREHFVWEKQGLVTITGGKLTTFRALAADALKAASKSFETKPGLKTHEPVFAPMPAIPQNHRGLDSGCLRRLYGRYGKAAKALVKEAGKDDLTQIPGTLTLWAELPAAAKNEKIRHLTDLLLRRVRIGILTPCGGRRHLDRIQELCRPVLDWDETRWKDERQAYCSYHDCVHSPGGGK